jgi:hypothetical protein
MTAIRAAFEAEGIMVPLELIHPIRQVKPTDAAFGKYRAVVASIREVGVIEPLIVHPQRGSKGPYYLLLDGHLRLKALKELERTEVFCLLAKEDEPFTYNDRVNRLSLIQEHSMILRAMRQGVTPEQIAKALAIDVAKIRARVNLLNGIHPDAVEILKDRPITAEALRLFRKAKAIRQIDMAQLMVSGNNFTRAYAEALIIGTPADQLVNAREAKQVKGMSPEEISRMEKEMETLERDYKLHQEQFGENSLHLNATQRYVRRLLENARVKRFLGNRYPEILEEFQDVVALEAL